MKEGKIKTIFGIRLSDDVEVLSYGIGIFNDFLKKNGIDAELKELNFNFIYSHAELDTTTNKYIISSKYKQKEIVDKLFNQLDIIDENIIGFSLYRNFNNRFNDINFLLISDLINKILSEKKDLIVVTNSKGKDGCDFSRIKSNYPDRFFEFEKKEEFLDFYKERFKFSKNFKYIADYELVPDYNGLDFNNCLYSRDKLFNRLYVKGVLKDISDPKVSYRPDMISNFFLIPYRFTQGCINNCAFCIWNEKCRVLKPKKVVENLEYLKKKYKSNKFMFLNSQVNISKDYAYELCEEIIRKDLNILWTDSASLNKIDINLARKMREAGCVQLWAGVESPSDKMLNFIGKNLTVKKAKKSINILNKAGIWIGCDLILGMPHENKEDIKQTLEFIKINKDIVDIWQVNKFRLKGKFFKYSEKYRIKIHNPKDNMFNLRFDELDGLKWNDKLKQTNEAIRKINELINCNFNNINYDHHLILSLYTHLGNKKDVKMWIKKNFINFFRESHPFS